jgi:hypothetical protein
VLDKVGFGYYYVGVGYKTHQQLAERLKRKGENYMFTQQKELSQKQIADAEKLCQIRQGIQPEQWPLLRMIFTAYMDGIGAGMQLSGTDSTKQRYEGRQ